MTTPEGLTMTLGMEPHETRPALRLGTIGGALERVRVEEKRDDRS
jgi:hypothetical protein